MRKHFAVTGLIWAMGILHINDDMSSIRVDDIMLENFASCGGCFKPPVFKICALIIFSLTLYKSCVLSIRVYKFSFYIYILYTADCSNTEPRRRNTLYFCLMYIIYSIILIVISSVRCTANTFCGHGSVYDINWNITSTGKSTI